MTLKINEENKAALLELNKEFNDDWAYILEEIAPTTIRIPIEHLAELKKILVVDDETMIKDLEESKNPRTYVIPAAFNRRFNRVIDYAVDNGIREAIFPWWQDEYSRWSEKLEPYEDMEIACP